MLDFGILAGFPALIYAWTVREVLRKTRASTPQVGTDHAAADKTHDFVRIEETDAWGDDSGMASYLLRCRMQPAPRSDSP